MKKPILISITLLLFVGCAAPELDLSSEDSAKKSMEAFHRALGDDGMKEFKSALSGLFVDAVAFQMKNAFTGKPFSEADIEVESKKLIEKLHGKTSDEILAEGKILKEELKAYEEQLEAKRKELERIQALAEIEEIRARFEDTQQLQAQFEKFSVISSKFYISTDSFIKEPVIEIKIKNNNEFPVTSMEFQGALTSPGRDTPWLEDTFSYEISGGLEPNEEAHWKLAPNMFSDWGKVEMRSDMLLTLRVIGCEKSSGEGLKISETTEDDKERLEQLLTLFSDVPQETQVAPVEPSVGDENKSSLGSV